MITNRIIGAVRDRSESPLARLLPAAGLALACAALVTACGQATAAPGPRALTTAGTVRDDIVVVAAPSITAPTLDLKVGISPSRLPTAPGLASDVMVNKSRTGSGGPGSASSSSSSGAPRVSGLLAVVTVRVGDTVKRGQVVARLDDTLLWLGVRKARADAAAARANIAALDARIADLKDKRSTARDARSKIRTGLATIATGKQKLATASGQLATGKDAALAQQATLRQARGKLTAGIAALSRQIAQLEKLPQPPAVVIAQLKAKRAALQGQLAQVDAGLGKIGAGLAKIGAGQATIGAASAKLAAGQAKARAGLVTVNAGISKLGDAITKLEKARTLAHAAVPVRDQAVATAKDQAARATIVTPVAGVVTAAMHTGETAMVGAPIVKVRRIGPSQVDTWVTLAELPLARTGTQATVTADSLKGQTLPAVVKTTSSEYAFPPSAFPTTEIHMLRTIRVTLELEAPGSLLPPGTPVDVTFATK